MMWHNLIPFYEQALYEALMRQEELLAYIDRQEVAKYQVNVRSPYFLFNCCALILPNFKWCRRRRSLAGFE